MSEEELIETLKAFEEKRVEQLPESARNLFYAIMKIADERDLYKKEIERLNNIINKAVEYIEYMQNISKNKNIYVSVYDLVKLLKGEDKE